MIAHWCEQNTDPKLNNWQERYNYLISNLYPYLEYSIVTTSKSRYSQILPVAKDICDRFNVPLIVGLEMKPFFNNISDLYFRNCWANLYETLIDMIKYSNTRTILFDMENVFRPIYDRNYILNTDTINHVSKIIYALREFTILWYPVLYWSNIASEHLIDSLHTAVPNSRYIENYVAKPSWDNPDHFRYQWYLKTKEIAKSNIFFGLPYCVYSENNTNYWNAGDVINKFKQNHRLCLFTNKSMVHMTDSLLPWLRNHVNKRVLNYEPSIIGKNESGEMD